MYIAISVADILKNLKSLGGNVDSDLTGRITYCEVAAGF